MSHTNEEDGQVSLIHFSNARRELELASSIDEVKAIRDRAEAIRVYVKQVGESLKMQNQCAEIRIRAERKAGKMLAARDKQQGARGKGINQYSQTEVELHDDTPPPRLKDLGISKSQSARWQVIASLPDEVFETHITDTITANKELTTADTLRLVKTLAKADKLAGFMADNSDAVAFSSLEDLIDSGQRFRTIYADPPWQYDNQGTRASTSNHYSTLTPAEIAALPIALLVADEAHLHIWTTNAFLFETKAIIEAWGFDYKSVFVWVKPKIGIGNYWRIAHEFLLLGVRGRLSFTDHSIPSWLKAERACHSKKPESMRQIIERVSPPPRLELFAREQLNGWSAWGNEICKDMTATSA